MGDALRRAACASAIVAFLALLVGSGTVHETLAVFNGETRNAGSTFAAGWVGAPSGATAAPSGYDVQLSWTPGTDGPVTGQELWGVDNGTSSDCTGAAYTMLAPMASAGTASYTDANRANATTNGNWYCYKLVSTSATAWTAEQPLPALRIGLAATSVATANGGSQGLLDAGDTITITFNQRTTLASGTVKVCALATGTILLGDTSGGSGCSAGDGYSIGRLTGGFLDTDVAFPSSSVAVSTSAPWTVTVTLGGTAATAFAIGTFSLEPAAGIVSFATTNQASVCTSSASTCRPAAASQF